MVDHNICPYHQAVSKEPNQIRLSHKIQSLKVVFKYAMYFYNVVNMKSIVSKQLATC